MPSVTDLPRKLDDGLLLRTAHREDGPELADFNGLMHGNDDFPGSGVADWTTDLFELDHPYFEPERDVTVVEDTATGRIVSTLFLLGQEWSYAGVTMPVGQPELIATHPEYRRRGLIRIQFDVVHEWSRAAGQLWQFIGGIPWYYRQFGYEYALDLPAPPILSLGPTPPPPVPDYSVRTATAADIPFLTEVSAAAAAQPGLTCVRDADVWHLELARRPGAVTARDVLIVEQLGGAGPIGYVAHHTRLRGGLVSLRAFDLLPGHNWLEPTAGVAAHFHRWLGERPDGPGLGVRLWLPAGHPALLCLGTRLGAGPASGYGNYVRVPDVVAFIDRVRPVLETRLAASPAVGWTGTVAINLYTEAVRLVFDAGRLTSVTRDPEILQSGNADISLPTESFLHLLLGNRTLDDLERRIADCRLGTDAGVLLLDVLFPRMPYASWELC